MVTNILKNGEVIKDLRGHVVKRADCPMAYEVLERKQKKGGKNEIFVKRRT